MAKERHRREQQEKEARQRREEEEEKLARHMREMHAKQADPNYQWV